MPFFHFMMLNIVKKLFFRIVKWFTITSIATVIIYRFVPPPFTPLMIIRCFEQTFDKNRSIKLKKDWVSYKKISKNLKLAIVTSEDQRFKYHHGFDFEAMMKAFSNNQKNKKLKGGSTISQQLAKNLFLWPSRSYTRKALETWFTFLIELFWSKERILEVYLNVIEWGDGIYGAEKASQQYFKKNADELSKEEAALLAAVVPGPLIYSVKKPGPYIRKKQSWIVRNMNRLGKTAINFD